MRRDFKYAFRLLLRAPGFTVVAVLTLALGIGANTDIFAWVNAELLEALPYRQPDRLLVLNEFANGRTVSVTYPDYLDWQRDNQTQHGAFAAMAWFQQQGFNLSGAGEPQQVQAADVSANFFATLGVRPALGREFSPGADSGAAAPEAILSYGLWQRQFGGSAAAIGKTLNLDQAAYTVAGVLPASYRDYNQTDLFVPAGRLLKRISDRGDHNDATVIARLAPGASAAGAGAQMRAEMAKLALAYPASDAAEGSVVRPIRALFVGNDAPMLWLLLVAVGLVLLIACVNVASLMLARTAARRPEWAVRAALGAGQGRLLRQLLIESLMLAAPGAVAGVGLAAAGLAGLQRLASNATLRLSLPVLGYAFGAAVLSAGVFGLAPARA
ncbi:MAG: ABC transporter permease, partial [Terriglobales bacterium]